MKVYAADIHGLANPWHQAPAWVIEIATMMGLILEKQGEIMATLDDVLNDVTGETTRLDSISTLISGLQQQLQDALAGTTLPAATQAKVDAIFAAAEANKAKIDAALNANTPPAPAP